MGKENAILEAIREEIRSLHPATVQENFGHVIAVADGVVLGSGLSQLCLNEKVLFADGSIGMALNLGDDNVGIVVISDEAKINVGDEIRTTGELLSVPVGKGLLGRIVNALGNPMDGRGPIHATDRYPV
ncbi:MAG: F0F1 ATP synthase subunit alpha, partial [Puniceicoccales bacterium]|nr:F0F1 ATP synthase subunit alpha [Puniceicoccales bacterium]